MKIFKMNNYDWVAAETLDEAVVALQEAYSFTDEELADSLDDPYQVADHHLDTLKFMDEENLDEEGNIVPITFRDQLKKMQESGETFPTIFASTEW